MKLLVDENLPPRLALLLSEAGHDAVHNFGALLAATGATAPSVILVREVVDLHPPELAQLLLTCIEQLEEQLAAGAMVALTRAGARVRRLPLL